MAGKTYRVCIEKADQKIEVEGDKQFVLEMLARFNPCEGKLQKTEPTPNRKAANQPSSLASLPGKKVSVGEFIRQLGFKKHTDLVLAFGYYLEKHGGLTAFTPADINTCYYDSKLESSNTSQMIIQNIRRSFLMQAKRDEGRKAYTLTRSGEEFVEGGGKKAKA